MISKCKNCALEKQTIINVIKVNPNIKQEEISKVINKSLRTVKTRMIEMQKKDLIARKNGNNKFEANASFSFKQLEILIKQRYNFYKIKEEFMKFIANRETLNLGLKIIAITIENIDVKTETQEFISFKNNAYIALQKKYKDFDIENDLILRGFNSLHKKIGLKRRKHTPISELILKHFLKGEKFTKADKLTHLYNITVLDSRLPIFIHDKDKIKGNVTLNITKKSETYTNKNNEEKNVNIGEYIYKDEIQVIQRLEIDQNKNTIVDENTKNILIIIEGNEDTSTEYLLDVASEIIDLINTYCNGIAKIIYN